MTKRRKGIPPEDVTIQVYNKVGKVYTWDEEGEEQETTGNAWCVSWTNPNFSSLTILCLNEAQAHAIAQCFRAGAIPIEASGLDM